MHRVPKKTPTFSSTRGWKPSEDGATFEDVVLLGLAPDGGLFGDFVGESPN